MPERDPGHRPEHDEPEQQQEHERTDEPERPERQERLAQDRVGEELSLPEPTLDDVFLSLTGHIAQEESQPAAPAGRTRRRRSA